jgi:hypothetical protein
MTAAAVVCARDARGGFAKVNVGSTFTILAGYAIRLGLLPLSTPNGPKRVSVFGSIFSCDYYRLHLIGD